MWNQARIGASEARRARKRYVEINQKSCQIFLRKQHFSGFLVPNVELPPICHSQFRPGPPSEQAQTASNFLRQVIDNSRLVNLEDLSVKPGKLAW